MLQQTRVETVLRYYDRFLASFPSLEDLAGAEVEDVLAVWSGLGYYRRARLLHEAAAVLLRKGGKIPQTAEELSRLPGIGRYTAAAISSIAHGEKILALDGNLERVLARLCGYPGEVKKAAGRSRLTEVGTELLDPYRPGDSNQALMELGATVCRPRKPLCSECPLKSSCVARSMGDPERFPVRPAPRQAVSERLTLVLVERAGRLLFFRRKESEAQLAGLWELPTVVVNEDSRANRELRMNYGGRWTLDEHQGSVRHTITHRKMRAEVWRGSFDAGGKIADAPEARWVPCSEVAKLATSSLTFKALELASPDGS